MEETIFFLDIEKNFYMTVNFFKTKGSVLDVHEMLCCVPAGKEEVEMSIE